MAEARERVRDRVREVEAALSNGFPRPKDRPNDEPRDLLSLLRDRRPEGTLDEPVAPLEMRPDGLSGAAGTLEGTGSGLGLARPRADRVIDVSFGTE